MTRKLVVDEVQADIDAQANDKKASGGVAADAEGAAPDDADDPEVGEEEAADLSAVAAVAAAAAAAACCPVLERLLRVQHGLAGGPIVLGKLCLRYPWAHPPPHPTPHVPTGFRSSPIDGFVPTRRP